MHFATNRHPHLELTNQAEYGVYITRSKLGVNMKLISLLPLAAALTATVAAGQDSSTAAKNLALNLYQDTVNRCPIGLQVDHGSFFFERRTDYGSGLHQQMPLAHAVQAIHLAMTNPSAREIVEVQFTIHGYSDKGRALFLMSGAPDLTRKITLKRDIEGKGQASSDLSLSGFTAVSSVDVDSLTYADGSMWNATASGVCSVTPKAFMLVSAR
jgi:hypothetical protein